MLFVEKGICHMQKTTITQLPDPSGFSADPFTDIIREGARKLIERAIHAELATLMAAFSGERLEDGRARLVPNTSKPARGHKIYPYLLRKLPITRPNQVWAI